MIWFLNILTLSIPDDCNSRSLLCPLNQISTFLQQRHDCKIRIAIKVSFLHCQFQIYFLARSTFVLMLLIYKYQILQVSLMSRFLVECMYYINIRYRYLKQNILDVIVPCTLFRYQVLQVLTQDIMVLCYVKLIYKVEFVTCAFHLVLRYCLQIRVSIKLFLFFSLLFYLKCNHKLIKMSWIKVASVH